MENYNLLPVPIRGQENPVNMQKSLSITSISEVFSQQHFGLSGRCFPSEFPAGTFIHFISSLIHASVTESNTWNHVEPGAEKLSKLKWENYIHSQRFPVLQFKAKEKNPQLSHCKAIQIFTLWTIRNILVFISESWTCPCGDNLHSFLMLTLDGGERSASHSGWIYPGLNHPPHTHRIKRWVGPRRSLDAVKNTTTCHCGDSNPVSSAP